MGERERAFLARKFKEYYKSHAVRGVPAIEQREFGIGEFGRKIVRRHMSFPGLSELNSFLRESAPPFISYSAAYYKHPSARPMDSKGFMGADLIYEFDADDIETKCKEEHDSWKCKNPACGAEGKGSVKACPKCGSPVEVKQWFCSECLGVAKKQTLKLLEVLSSELGFTEGISVNFSGKAGFHVHIRSKKAISLSGNARNELIDYLTLNGFELEGIGFGKTESSMLTCPVPEKARGIERRFMERLASFIENWSAEKLAVHGNIKRVRSRFILKNKETILEKMRKGILFPIPAEKPGTSKKFWHLLAMEALREESIALSIDRQTSVDVHKILRLPGSLHGSTGLVARELSLKELEDFDPFTDAVVFEGEPVRVFINKAPKFSLGGESFPAFTEAVEELPLSAAVYLIGMGRAVLR